MNVTPCPLCGNALHTGKCPKPPPQGKWWCAACLRAKVTPGAKLSSDILLAAGVKRVTTWCFKCGLPFCSDHGVANRRYPRCSGDCRSRSPVELARIKALLSVYVPDYLTAGPTRCTACRRPAYRRNLCRSHYRQVRMGRVMLEKARVRQAPEGRAVRKVVSLPKSLVPHAQRLADAAGMTVSRWMSELVRREIKSVLKVQPSKVATIWDEP